MNPESTATHLLPAERRTVGVVATIAVIRMFGLFALLPVLSLYAGQLEGQTPLLIGLAVGGYGLTQALMQIPMGSLSDRIGRVPVILGGLAVFAVGSVVAATADSIYVLIAGRLLQGAGAISATLTALVTDATREVVRTRSMAVFGIGIGLSFFIAMVAGPVIAARFGVPALFWLAAGLTGVAAGLLALLPARPPVVAGDRRIGLALQPQLLRIDLYVFLLHAIMTALFVALPFLLRGRLGMPQADHWMIYVGALALSLLITVPLILSDHRSGQPRLLGFAILLLTLALLGLSFMAVNAWFVLVALAIYFGGFNFLEAGLPARLSVLADESSRGASLGVFSSAQFLGAFVGGLIGGRFLGNGEPQYVFFVCALIAAIWLALHGLKFPSKSRKSS